MAEVNEISSQDLFGVVDDKYKRGYTKIHLLISSGGGSVFHGISLYNYLKGIPVKIITYNFGSVDSIGVVVFCSGDERFSVNNARFLLHPIQMSFFGNQQVVWDEKTVEEKRKSLKIDQDNISKIISETTQKPQQDILNDIHDRTTLTPDEAKKYKLVHEIKASLLPAQCELYSVHNRIAQPGVVIPPSFPMGAGGSSTKIANSFTRLEQLDHFTSSL